MFTHRLLALLTLLAAYLSALPAARATVNDPAFTEAQFLASGVGLSQVTGMAWAPDGSNRLFITLKSGTVRIVRLDGTILATPFATETVFTNSECGLIGLAFDPAFATNGHVYLFATASNSEQRIIRYTAVGDTGTARTVLVSGLPTVGNNHDGGSVGIGFDGKLYWGIGDLGNGTGVDANLTSLAAKIGRANRDGSVPADNPFADGAGPNNDYIWARGLRNPYTFAFQPGTGALFVDVVGTSYEQVFIVTAGSHAGYNDYENNQPAGYLTPVLKYRTNGTDTRTIAGGGAVRSGGVVTFTTTGTHGFRRGERLTIAGVADPGFIGDVYVATTPTTTTFTAAQTGANASSGGGSARTAALGGCITGASFYDSTAVPPAYRGNYFFGDLNSGNLVRASLDGANTVSTVDVFATGFGQAIDTAVGPDGRLYGVQHDGRIVRWTYTPSGQGLIVTPTNLRTDEGAQIAFSVRLAQAPGADVTVAVARTAGDTGLTIASSAALTFTPANWATPQPVLLAAAEDADATDDAASFSVTSAGLTSQVVPLTALDNDAPSIALSSSTLNLVEGTSATFGVALTGPPAGGTVTLTIARTGGDTDISISAGATLTFTTANFATEQLVTVQSAEDPDATPDTATVSITATGFTTRSVAVTAADNDTLAPAITTPPVLTAIAGAQYSYDVDATGNPPATFTLDAAPSGLGIAPSTGIITWIPAAAGSFAVTVRAANGVAPDALQSFTIVVAPDLPPEAHLTRPHVGEFVSGTNAEWFGDGHDEAGTVQGQFFVDDVLVHTDTTPGGHYHFGSAHFLWDTTALTNGAHRLRLTVTDTIGQTASTEVDVIVANGIAPWEAWRLAQFTPAELGNPAISGETADYDGDGLNTVLEYAFGGDPRLADADMIGPVLGQDSGYLTLTYTRVLGASDLLYALQSSSDLTAWTSALPGQSTVVPAGATERVTLRDSMALTSTPRRFLRLAVTRTGP